MDYEKLYKEALERARQVHATNVDENKKSTEYIFPELKESEDERIRKWCISHFKECINVIKDNDEYKEYLSNKVIAWLEKQGEQKSKKVFLWKHWKDGIAGNGEGQLIYLVKVDNTYRLTSCLGFECDYIELSELDELLEKQGENPQGKSALEAIKEEKVDNANKVEPKFNVEDWITNDTNGVWKIVGKLNNFYILEDQNGAEYRPTTTWVDEHYRLWSIKDAKDGDILALNDEVFIYAHRKQLYNIAIAHCFVDSADGFYLEGEFVYTEKGNSIHPATKKQCNTLMLATTKARYVWNITKKNLIKL